ncbi:hypothetical protein [uncultured Paraglaciecola sp.]|uniref:hypothetical protein n=1 Tax=uncultured Paraglaciecola sp. TaxID=1765024 RepID=UPI00262EDB5B|nr:hypothetical protein [uncultured Paraglaciecola sp.]
MAIKLQQITGNKLHERLAAYCLPIFEASLKTIRRHENGKPTETYLESNIEVTDGTVILLVARLNHDFEDGEFTAFLNPSDTCRELVKRWKSTTYFGNDFSRLYGKECDSAVCVWVDSYQEDGVCIRNKYTSESSKNNEYWL